MQMKECFSSKISFFCQQLKFSFKTTFKKCSEDNIAELIKRRQLCNTQDILIITTNYKEK